MDLGKMGYLLLLRLLSGLLDLIHGLLVLLVRPRLLLLLLLSLLGLLLGRMLLLLLLLLGMLLVMHVLSLNDSVSRSDMTPIGERRASGR